MYEGGVLFTRLEKGCCLLFKLEIMKKGNLYLKTTKFVVLL